MPSRLKGMETSLMPLTNASSWSAGLFGNAFPVEGNGNSVSDAWANNSPQACSEMPSRLKGMETYGFQTAPSGEGTRFGNAFPVEGNGN